MEYRNNEFLVQADNNSGGMVQCMESYEKIYHCIKALSIERYAKINALQIKTSSLSRSAPLDAESLAQLHLSQERANWYQY